MKKLKDFLFESAPNFIHNIIITLYNIKNNNVRLSGNYNFYKNNFKEQKTLEEINDYQLKELNDFISFAIKNSKYYKNSILKFEPLKSLSELKNYPILTKDLIRENINDIITLPKNKAIQIKTGGTTGKSLKVYNTKDDIRRRFASLDVFREKYGYRLGKKTAWFSGKNILNKRNLKNNVFWKYDFFNKVRYYSTFHCSGKNLEFILNDLIRFSPKIMSGFPSSMADIARYGIKNNIVFPTKVDVVFTTAEKLSEDDRNAIERYFMTKIYDQYASSEGAPFIFECEEGKYHIDAQSGVIEVVDDNGNYSTEGRMLVTSFHTRGTPLIRYDIGDSIKLSNKKTCECGDLGKMVESIEGRSKDYIYSKETGKITSANMSNAVKQVKGIINCKMIQNSLEEISILIIRDNDYNAQQEAIFLNELRDRVGEKMEIYFEYVNSFEKEKSGKFRFIKNNILNKIDGVKA